MSNNVPLISLIKIKQESPIEHDDNFIKYLKRARPNKRSKTLLDGKSTQEPKTSTKKLSNVINKYSKKLLPQNELKQQKFEKNFTVFQDLKTFLPIQKYIQQLSNKKLQNVEQLWKKLRIKQTFKHYAHEMDIMLSKEGITEENLNYDFSTLQRAYNTLESSKFTRTQGVKENLCQKIVDQINMQKQSVRIENNDDVRDDFYEKIDQQLQSYQVQQRDFANDSQVQDARKILTRIGMDSDEQDKHIEIFMDSPRKNLISGNNSPVNKGSPITKAKYLEKIENVRLDFTKQAQNVIRILRKQTQNIYKKDVVEAIEKEQKQTEEIKQIKEKILNKKRLNIQRLEDQLDTMESDEIDLKNMKFRMSPQVRSSIVRVSNQSPSFTKRNHQNSKSEANLNMLSLFAQNQAKNIKRTAQLSGLYPPVERSLQQNVTTLMSTISNTEPEPISIKEQVQHTKAQVRILKQLATQTKPFNIMELKQQIYDNSSKKNVKLPQLEPKSQIVLPSNTQKRQINFKMNQYTKKTKTNETQERQLQSSTHSYTSSSSLKKQRNQFTLLVNDIENFYDENKIQRFTYQDVINKLERNKEQTIEKIFKNKDEDMETLKFLLKQSSSPRRQSIQKISKNRQVL